MAAGLFRCYRMPSNAVKATALDFATRSIFDGQAAGGSSRHETTQEAEAEIIATMTELMQSFGPEAVGRAMAELMPAVETGGNMERLLQFARGYSVLILESDRPKLVAALVGKLSKLEMATGRRIELKELGRANGISKQAVSRKLATYAERLNLPRPDSTPEARRSHQLMNRRNYGNRRTVAA